jgi:hypothetical protein
MRRLPIPFLFMAALAIAVPAAAQIVGRHDYGMVGRPDPFLGNGRMPGPSVGDELRDIDRRIDRARDSGHLSSREARQLRREARAIAWVGRHGHGDLSASQRLELTVRFQNLRDAINRPRPIHSRRESRRGR